ncbi:partner and localizer of BRCA2 isoform X2 [Dendropsophus ebraccatus]|uniref:partner and localizer of BRCA2 isoform X2 n=1 Tax=Dendropsophus ebraccatus TaxID=150705 RepID=UPI0038319BB6
MTAACDMESIPEKHLTVEEKTKLKERLALLKKEYKKTVHRLQRSQRAERVKTHVKKTIEEQNRLLSQELSNPHSGSVLTGPLNDASNVAGKVCASQSVISPSADKERKLSVSFNLDPEVLHDDKKSPACSGSESSGQEPSAASKTEPTQSSNPNQYKRSRLRLNRSARRVYTESMSPSTVTSLQGQHTIEAACTKGTAPNNKCLTEDEALRIHAVSENTRPVQASPDRDLSVSVLGQKNSNTEATNAPASPVFNKEDVLTTVKASSGSLEGLYPKEETLDTGQSGEVTTDRSQAAHSNASNIDHLTGDRLPPVTKLLKGTSQELSADLHPVPEVVETSPPLSENHPGAAVKYNGESSVMDAERSPLDSCTLVEGLLFPVEYYVRTTRRMTSCQRKVDLEAVIHSQLGTTRRGMRQRRASISSTPSLQVSGTPVRTPSHSATRSRRGRGRKSCPASVSSGLQNISVQLKFGSDATPITDGSQVVKETLQEKELGIQTGAENLQIKEGVKRVEAVTPKSGGRKVHRSGAEEDYIHGLHDSTNLTEKIQDIRTSRERSEPSSPFYLPSSRLHLQHLLRHLDITDFHLPDEDFGVLKLEKLKSASHLEMFIPDPTKEKKRYRRAYSTDSSTMPATDPSALLHGAVQVCTNAALLTPSKNCPDGEQLPAGDGVPRPVEASQAFLGMETPEVFRVSPSKETCAPGSLEETHCDAPQCSAALETTYPITGVSRQASSAPLDPDTTTSIETKREGLLVLSTYINPLEAKPPANVRSSTKELNVLLSTSMCSVPVDTPAECVPPGCTLGFPLLGSTPAVFSSPQGCSSPAPRQQPMSTRTIQLPPDESALVNNEDELVPQDGSETHQYSEPLLLPPSGEAAPVYVKKPCSHEEDSEENATISDQWNTDGMLGGDCLRLVSEIKVKDTCTGGCPVDLCSVWWEFSGCDDLCIVSATEYSVCLWRPQEVHKWKCVHTWNFSEMPVIQILPLYQEKNVVCIALGNLDIMEIWALSSHPQLHTWEKQLVKSGHTKTAQGLSRGRVVSSSGGGGTQVLELWQLSENGSVSGSHTLAAPKDSIVAFSEVDGESDALVGSTVDNNLVLWNSVTGHLLNTFQIGSLCSDITCISATSDSGLLFFVVGSLFSKPSEISGSCIFRLIVTNPQGGASAFIMAYTLPEGLGSRYLEGDVKKQRAAAVLTCGSIALWDLPRSHCSAVLPPDSDTPWCLVRWGNRPSCLLAGRKDGTICVYEYTDCG